VWADTRIQLPPELADGTLRDVFTGATIAAEHVDGAPALSAAAVFERLPVALLVPCST
jgi:maltooligosyltrehalose synthase